jgi:hypothetical protein
MPQIISCPDCERKLRVPDDLLGKKVKCPGCSVMFKAVVAGGEEEELEEVDEEPAPRKRAAAREERVSERPNGRRPSRRDEEEEDDRPSRRRRDDDDDDDRRSSRRRRRDDDDDEDYPRSRRRRYDDDDDYDDDRREMSPARQKTAWGKVRTGINLVMIGTWVWVGGSFIFALCAALAAILLGSAITSLMSGSPGSADGSLGTAVGGGLVLVAGAGILALCSFVEVVMRLVGYGMCMGVPAKRNTGLKPLAITAFSLAAAHAAFNLLTNLASWGSSGSGAMMMAGHQGVGAIGLGIGLIGFASFVVWCFFLRSICGVMKERGLAGTCLTVFIVFICYYVLATIIAVVLIFAVVGSAFAAASSRTASGATTTLGAMGIIAIIVIGLLFLGHLGIHVWYIMVLQKVRDALDSYRRRLE